MVDRKVRVKSLTNDLSVENQDVQKILVLSACWQRTAMSTFWKIS